MKVLFYGQERLPAEKIVKKADTIIGYIGEKEVFAFRGITDWSIFSIEGGDFDPDPDVEKEQRLADIETAIAAILGGAM